ncbi:MAG: metallophosphoesterase, partial [Chitinophagaceae bacterium]
MRILIYSDVHGNLPAFETVIKAADTCDQYICLGDLVNYGPWSNECVDLALSLPSSVMLMGNHEEAFIDGRYPGSNPLVQLFFATTITDFKRKEEIKKFIPEYKLDDYLCRHTILDKNIYPDTDVVLDANYIIGHSHHQFRYESN